MHAFGGGVLCEKYPFADIRRMHKDEEWACNLDVHPATRH